MQASIESTGNLERRLSFSLPEERLQSHIVGRLGEIARTPASRVSVRARCRPR